MYNSQGPLVSIAMCTYNGERFLKEQVDSLVAQDYPNIEIIITDDCSNDSTIAILEDYVNSYPQIRLYKNSKNLGYKRNFEKALKLCKGEYIALCDQDDIWFPNKVSQYVEQIGECSLIYSGVQMIDEHGEWIESDFPGVNLLEGRCCLGLLFGNCVTGHASLIPKDLLKHALPIPKDVKMHDHWLAYVAATINGIKYIDEPLSLYRKHSNNVALKNRKTKKTKKYSKITNKHKQDNAFLHAASKLETLKPKEKEYIYNLIEAVGISPKLVLNYKLLLFLKKQPEALIIFKDPGRMGKKLAKGILLKII